jgi:hypothetical protein
MRAAILIACVVQVLLWCYCIWQYGWLASAWGTVVHEGEPLENMASSIEWRMGRLNAGLLLLGASVVVTCVLAAVSGRRGRGGRGDSLSPRGGDALHRGGAETRREQA